MLKRSEFKRGEFLVTSNGSIFIHDGYKNGDGYGCLIGLDSNGELNRYKKLTNFTFTDVYIYLKELEE